MKTLSSKTRKIILESQRNEITEYHIYRMLSEKIKNGKNKEVLKKISEDELRHYGVWKKYTGVDVKPDQVKIMWYYFVSRILGLTFGIKLMEAGEETAQATYSKISSEVPEAKEIIKDEDEHEHELIALIDEEKLRYVGSIVLGLNDALVELTGTLAGLSFAFQNTRLVAIAGLITGIAASFSMAASEYLSTKSEAENKHPLKAAVYTGSAYIITVLILITPYFIFQEYYYALIATLINATIIIASFTYYNSITKNKPFKKDFMEMTSISLGIATLSFIIGYLIRTQLGIEI